MAIFLEELKHVSEHSHRDPGAILISGGGGLGKTKLLRAIKAKAAQMGFRWAYSRVWTCKTAVWYYVYCNEVL